MFRDLHTAHRNGVAMIVHRQSYTDVQPKNHGNPGAVSHADRQSGRALAVRTSKEARGSSGGTRIRRNDRQTDAHRGTQGMMREDEAFARGELSL